MARLKAAEKRLLEIIKNPVSWGEAFLQNRDGYNNVRPHEALGMKVPGDVYRCSTRKIPTSRDYPYDPEFEIRRIRKDGMIKVRSKTVFVSEALARQNVGLERIDCNRYRVWFCNLDFGVIDV